MNSYHNTTNETHPKLKDYEFKSQNQEGKILEVFYVYGTALTPSKVWYHFPFWPLTSVRRGITNLTKKGKLVKTDEKVIGPYGRPEYKWYAKIFLCK